MLLVFSGISPISSKDWEVSRPTCAVAAGLAPVERRIDHYREIPPHLFLLLAPAASSGRGQEKKLRMRAAAGSPPNPSFRRGKPGGDESGPGQLENQETVVGLKSLEFTMGLLDKTNPKATAWSVLRSALVSAIVAAIVFFVAFKPSYKEVWPVTLPLWVLLCALVGGLMEWQGGDPSAEDDEPPGDE
jgi:hypothetical protein